MYEELVKRLRYENLDLLQMIDLLDEAADAIEELSAHYCKHMVRNVHDRGDDSLCRLLKTEPPKEET